MSVKAPGLGLRTGADILTGSQMTHSSSSLVPENKPCPFNSPCCVLFVCLIQEATKNASCHLHLHRATRCITFAWRQDGVECWGFSLTCLRDQSQVESFYFLKTSLLLVNILDQTLYISSYHMEYLVLGIIANQSDT